MRCAHTVVLAGACLLPARGMAQRAGARAVHVVSNTTTALVDAAPLRSDAPRREVTYTLRAGVTNTANPELNFNGASMGEEELHVPLGWSVVVRFINVGQAPHSMRMLGDGEIPVTVGPAVIAGAETPRGQVGLPPGATHIVHFTAARRGRYRLSCAVNAHGYAGMWVRVVVDPEFTRAEIVHRPAEP